MAPTGIVSILSTHERGYLSADGTIRTMDGRCIGERDLPQTVTVTMTELKQALALVTGQTMSIADLWTSDCGQTVTVVPK